MKKHILKVKAASICNSLQNPRFSALWSIGINPICGTMFGHILTKLGQMFEQLLIFIISLIANIFSALSGGGAGLIQLPVLDRKSGV